MKKGELIRATHGISGLSSLQRIEPKHRHQHSLLEPNDECWFIADYHSGTSRGYEVNQLIFDWKCMPSAAALDGRKQRSKETAIHTVAAILRHCCNRLWSENATWCPVPTSRAIGNANYDDRLLRTLRIAFEGYDLDLRVLLTQGANTQADHIAERRLSRDDLFEVLKVETGALGQLPLRQRIVLFDDILTSGKHFKCCQHRLREVVPDVPVCGLFFARRVQCSRWWRCSSSRI